MLVGRKRREQYEHAGFLLYATAVAAARAPYLYGTLGVADTLDGRFDLVCLYVSLLIRRLQADPAPGPTLAQAVFDAMFSDMDQTLREMGVGDLSVGRRVRAMWEALHGRALAYQAAVGARDFTALKGALARNVWRGAVPAEGAAVALAKLTFAQAEFLDGQKLSDLAAGKAAFLPAMEAAQ